MVRIVSFLPGIADELIQFGCDVFGSLGVRRI
jgi:hypothetical protein